MTTLSERLVQLFQANNNITFLKKILLLDDSEDIIDIVKEVLSYEQFEVHALRHSEGLLAEAQRFRPDLILLDYRLGDTDGKQLCQMFKAHPDFKSIPVIIFSAYFHADIDFASFGCDAFIAKPFDIEELTNTVRSLIGN